METTQTRKQQRDAMWALYKAQQRQRFAVRDYVVMGENVIVTAFDVHGRTWTAFTHLPTGDMHIMDYGGEVFATQDDMLSSRADDFWVWAEVASYDPDTTIERN